MKVRDILKQNVTILGSVDGWCTVKGYDDMIYSHVNFGTVYDALTLGQQMKDMIAKLRTYPHDEYKELKKNFPCWFPAGTFPFFMTEDKDIMTYTNIMAIDIDTDGNEGKDLQDIRKKIYELPYVFAVLSSISGKGIYALILVHDGHYTEEYYRYISRLWRQKFDIVIDGHCVNVGRKRFISYDDDIMNWIKDEDTEIKSWTLRELPQKKEEPKPSYFMTYKPKSQGTSGLASKAIWKLLDNGFSIDDMNVTYFYAAWYHVACEFKHFDDGEAMFIRFSQNSSKYHDSLNKIKAKYNEAKTELTIDEVARKWCGICKNKFGSQWWK